MYEHEKLDSDKKGEMMASLMTSLDIENETQKKHIQELEQFVNLLSSALTDSGSEIVNSQNKSGEAALIK